jgi:hypothetical protein
MHLDGDDACRTASRACIHIAHATGGDALGEGVPTSEVLPIMGIIRSPLS